MPLLSDVQQKINNTVTDRSSRVQECMVEPNPAQYKSLIVATLCSI